MQLDRSRGQRRLTANITKRLSIFAVPAAVLAMAGFLVPRFPGMSPGRQELLLLSPYLITALGTLLSVYFHRGRPFMVLLLMTVFYWGSRSYLVEKAFEPSLNQLYQAFVLIIPFNIALIAVMRERGIVTTAGRRRFWFLAVQAVIAFWFFRYNFFSSLPFFAGNLGLPPAITPDLIPQPALISACAAIMVTAGLAIYRKSPVDAGLLGALIAFLIACNRITTPEIHAAYTSAGVLILTLCIVRDSYNMAFRDDLTGLRSRRSLNESLNGLGRSYAIAMVDVDHFKQFNDTYGHATGDQVLKMVASKMADVGGGTPYRYGGEEFTILYPGRSVADVIPELEKLRATIANYQMALRDAERPANSKEGKTRRGSRREASHVSVTISIGVAERSAELATPEAVIKAADKALYRAKNRGRNQVCR